jgi:hypothetical protein
MDTGGTNGNEFVARYIETEDSDRRAIRIGYDACIWE